MSSQAYQKLSRIDIAVALDTTASRFCVLFKELDAFANAAKGWNVDVSEGLDNVLHAGPSHHDYKKVGESLKHELALFTSDAVMGDNSYLAETKLDAIDVRACLHASMKLWEMGVILESCMLKYPLVLRNMRSKNYRGIDKLDSMYNHFFNELQVLIETRVRNLHFSAKAIGLYAPAFGCLHRNVIKSLACAVALKPQLLEFTQTHNQFVAASHPAISGRALACA